MLRILAVFILVLTPLQGFSATAVFAGGCFWCMESDFQDVPGVTDVVSGFSGGTHPNPTYRGPHDGHYEAIQVTYDPALISFEDLLTLFWVNIDPFDAGGQFCDRGESYRTALFVKGAQERELAEASRADVQSLFPGQEVVTPILERDTFFPVEEYHQDYYKKNPLRYRYYRYSCGRDKRLEEVWAGTDLRERASALAPEH